MEIITDLHIHSKYSRAVSQKMVIREIGQWAKRKGIDLVATGDWTHPLWMREIKANLIEDGSGLLKLKTQNSKLKTTTENLNFEEVHDPLFLLSTEISSIYSQGGKLRRIHTLVWSPSIETCEKINKELLQRGAKLMSDGRPILGLSSIQLADLVFSIDPACLVIPAHIWTPWFSLYGSQSGFDSIDECFGEFAKYIYGIETGLSSDPAMNWRVKELENRTILSFSDAHSGPKLGREATVFRIKNHPPASAMLKALRAGESRIKDISYQDIAKAIKNEEDGDWEITYTIEFHPEEGKYHYTGHRNCEIRQSPSETRKKGTICPVCGRKLTVGVMHRVEQLAGIDEEELQLSVISCQLLENGAGIQMTKSKLFPNRPPYVMLVPLQEILAEVLGSSPTTQKVQNEYKILTEDLGGEFAVLLKAEIADIEKISGEKVGEAVHKVRTGDISVDPGYDGIFGKVKIWSEEKKEEEKKEKEQLSLF